MRRLAIQVGAVVLLSAACGGPDPVVHVAPDLEWLTSSGRPVDPDISKTLGPLEERVGNARLVLLGEPAHSDGGALAAKARIAISLHERLGFDLVAWEAGLWSCSLLDENLRGERALHEVARASLPDIWAASAEVRPLLDVARASWSGGTPLRMAGFDTNLTGGSTWAEMTAEIDAWVRGLGVRGVPLELVGELAMGVQTDPAAPSSRPASHEQVQRVAVAAAALEELWPSLAPGDPELAARHVLLGRVIHHIGAAAELVTMIRPLLRLGPVGMIPPIQKRYFLPMLRRREEQMADNLAWLLESNPRSKIVVWAASAHVLRGFDTMSYPEGRVDLSRKVTVGDMIARRVPPSEIYALAVVSGGGSVGYPGQSPRQLPVPGPDTFERAANRTGLGSFFLDLKGRRAEARSGLGTALSVGALGYGPIVGDWTRVADGFLYLPETRPSTLPADWVEEQDGASAE